MVMSHNPHKIEKSLRHGKAMCVTCLLLVLSLSHTSPFACNCAYGRAGGEIRERGARAAGMGGAAAAVPGQSADVPRNPALLAGIPRSGAVHWTPARFGMGELGSAAASWVQPIGGGAVAAELQRYGGEAYAEHRLGAGVGVDIGERLTAGARLSLLHVGIARYGESSVPVVDVGALFAVTDAFRVGVSGSAINMPSVAGDERIPMELTAGASWRHAGMLVALDVEKETRHDVNLRLGTEVTLLDVLALRCCVSTVTRQWTAGLGLWRGIFRVDYAIAVHSELGATHTVSVGFAP